MLRETPSPLAMADIDQPSLASDFTLACGSAALFLTGNCGMPTASRTRFSISTARSAFSRRNSRAAAGGCVDAYSSQNGLGSLGAWENRLLLPVTYG